MGHFDCCISDAESANADRHYHMTDKSQPNRSLAMSTMIKQLCSKSVYLINKMITISRHLPVNIRFHNFRHTCSMLR